MNTPLIATKTIANSMAEMRSTMPSRIARMAIAICTRALRCVRSAYQSPLKAKPKPAMNCAQPLFCGCLGGGVDSLMGRCSPPGCFHNSLLYVYHHLVTCFGLIVVADEVQHAM